MTIVLLTCKTLTMRSFVSKRPACSCATTLIELMKVKNAARVPTNTFVELCAIKHEAIKVVRLKSQQDT